MRTMNNGYTGIITWEIGRIKKTIKREEQEIYTRK